MKFALIVTDQYPFPIRNGVTVPLGNYIKALREYGFHLHLLVLKKDGRSCEMSNEEIHLFDLVEVVEVRRRAKLLAVAMQLCGKCPYFANWVMKDDLPENICKQRYDLIWMTPRSVIQVVMDLKRVDSIRAKLLLGAVNDVTTLVLSRHAKNFSKKQGMVLGGFGSLWLRLQSLLLKRAEINLIKSCDLAVVQTEEELSWLRRNMSAEEVSSVLALSNGVDDMYFNIPIRRESKSMVFIGALNKTYGHRFMWFLQSVFPIVRKAHPDCSLTVIGRCDREDWGRMLKEHEVRHIRYVSDPLELYRPYAIAIAPIFKGYGLINKVVQAMASGTVVVGDQTAFNGINGFRSGTHGFASDVAEGFSKAINSCFEDFEMRNRISSNARDVIMRDFKWKDRFDILTEKIDAGI